MHGMFDHRDPVRAQLMATVIELQQENEELLRRNENQSNMLRGQEATIRALHVTLKLSEHGIKPDEELAKQVAAIIEDSADEILHTSPDDVPSGGGAVLPAPEGIDSPALLLADVHPEQPVRCASCKEGSVFKDWVEHSSRVVHDLHVMFVKCPTCGAWNSLEPLVNSLPFEAQVAEMAGDVPEPVEVDVEEFIDDPRREVGEVSVSIGNPEYEEVMDRPKEAVLPPEAHVEQAKVTTPVDDSPEKPVEDIYIPVS